MFILKNRPMQETPNGSDPGSGGGAGGAPGGGDVGAGTPAGTGGAAGGGTGGAPGAAVGRPDWLPEKFWDPSANTARVEALAKSYGELERARQQTTEQLRPEVEAAIREEMRKGVPDKPEAYALPTAADLKLPEGIDIKVLEDAPLLAKFRDVAHKHGVPQETFNELFGEYVQDQLGRLDPSAEIAKLGETGPQRMANVREYLSKRLGAEGSAALEPAIIDAASFQALEKLLMEAGGMQPVSHTPGASGGTGGGDTRESLEKLMEDPRYHDPAKMDPQYIADIQQRFQRLFPGKRRVG